MMRSLILFLLLSTMVLPAQDFTHALAGITKVVVTAETSIIVKPHSEEVLSIKASENIRTNIPAKAAGLTSMTGAGTDNTNFGAAVEQVGSLLIVTGLRDRSADDLVLHLPPAMNVSVEVVRNNDIYIEGFRGEIEAINHLGVIRLTDVVGPVVTQNTNGYTKVVFAEVSQMSPSSLVSTNGDIDVTLPTTTPASLLVKTRRGDFYTDFEIAMDPVQAGNRDRRTVVGTVNGGGVLIDLRSLQGTIYLRKM